MTRYARTLAALVVATSVTGCLSYHRGSTEPKPEITFVIGVAEVVLASLIAIPQRDGESYSYAVRDVRAFGAIGLADILVYWVMVMSDSDASN